MVVHRPADVAPWLLRASLTAAIIAMSIVGAASQDRRPGRVAGQDITKPDYDRVFAMDRVHELRIHIPAERFREMQADLSTLARGRGGRAFGPGQMPGPPPDGLFVSCGGLTGTGSSPGGSSMLTSPTQPMRLADAAIRARRVRIVFSEWMSEGEGALDCAD